MPLTRYGTETYQDSSAYNRAVDDFGERLRRVREACGATQIGVARNAFKDEHGQPAPESFSNHLSRVERGEEPNPSLLFLERTAKGLGLSLAVFFAQIELASSNAPRPEAVGPQPSELDEATAESLPADDPDVRAAIQILARIALRERERAIAASHQQAPGARTGASQRSPHRRKSHRRPAGRTKRTQR